MTVRAMGERARLGNRSPTDAEHRENNKHCHCYRATIEWKKAFDIGNFNVSLTEELARYVNIKIESRRYTSSNKV